MRKVCTGCKIEKDVRQFYTQKSGKYGRTGECKECRRQRNKDYKKANPEKVRLKESLYQARIRAQYKDACPHDHVMIKEWTPMQFEIYARKKMRNLSNNLMNYAVRIGLLERKDKCENCGSADQIEGHHEDYHEPLQVIWLCQNCHVELHNDRRSIEQ